MFAGVDGELGLLIKVVIKIVKTVLAVLAVHVGEPAGILEAGHGLDVMRTVLIGRDAQVTVNVCVINHLKELRDEGLHVVVICILILLSGDGDSGVGTVDAVPLGVDKLLKTLRAEESGEHGGRHPRAGRETFVAGHSGIFIITVLQVIPGDVFPGDEDVFIQVCQLVLGGIVQPVVFRGPVGIFAAHGDVGGAERDDHRAHGHENDERGQNQDHGRAFLIEVFSHGHPPSGPAYWAR
ncbi:hypothetical protein SDC9_106057 [bioreactor metagenome]|uniref:Uncharacterized protein n=1 Tax=bioreactor metagenome TaxID=1076179 RepID=A0A645B1C9_9ZZZZ